MDLLSNNKSSQNTVQVVDEYIQEETGEEKASAENRDKPENFTRVELQSKSMPELWKITSSLGLSKKGKKDQLINRIVEAQKRMVDLEEDLDVLKILENLKDELKEFENIREGIKKRIESTTELVPNLKEKREQLEQQNQQKNDQLQEIKDLIPKLRSKKDNLEAQVLKKQEEIQLLQKEIQEQNEKVQEIDKLVPKLERNKDVIDKTVQKNSVAIVRIDEQIKQIMSLKEYGVDLLSTLMYAKKRKQE